MEKKFGRVQFSGQGTGFKQISNCFSQEIQQASGIHRNVLTVKLGIISPGCFFRVFFWPWAQGRAPSVHHEMEEAGCMDQPIGWSKKMQHCVIYCDAMFSVSHVTQMLPFLFQYYAIVFQPT